LEEIALKIAQLPKLNAEKKRLVVITQGDKPVIVANGERALIHVSEVSIGFMLERNFFSRKRSEDDTNFEITARKSH
jgi:hypothetical protein